MSFGTERDYDHIVNIGQSILALHQEKEWKDKTRSNFAHYRFESLYFAVEELEIVLSSWKRIAESDLKRDNDIPDDKITRESNLSKFREARNNYYKNFKRSNVVVDCINVLKVFKEALKYHFIRPLLEAFPRDIPVEVRLFVLLI